MESLPIIQKCFGFLGKSFTERKENMRGLPILVIFSHPENVGQLSGQESQLNLSVENNDPGNSFGLQFYPNESHLF